MTSLRTSAWEARGLSASGSFLPLPYPHRFFFFFGFRPIFRAGKIPKTPFLGLSLFPNSTETLATQARFCRVTNTLRCACVEGNTRITLWLFVKKEAVL